MQFLKKDVWYIFLNIQLYKENDTILQKFNLKRIFKLILDSV